MNKSDLVFSNDYQNQEQRQRKMRKNQTDGCRTSISMVSDEKQLQQMMKELKQKEKQEKRLYVQDRNKEKRKKNVVRLESRKEKDIEKMCSVRVFDEQEEHDGTGIWKHYCEKLNDEICTECFYGSTPTYSN